MEQLTIRGIDEELERRLRDEARSKGLSLNKAALRLMRRGAGVNEPGGNVGAVADSLDEFFGGWSEAETRCFLDSIAVFEQVDEEIWR